MKRYLLVFWVITFGQVYSASAEEIHVGVLYWSMNIAGQVAMRQGLEDERARLNAAAAKNDDSIVVLETRVAGDGVERIENQVKQMENLITTGIDLFIGQPTDNAALAAPLRQANAAKIPVIAYDQYIESGNLTAYRTSDNYQAGYLDGEYIASRFPAGKELRIVLVEYPHVSPTVERVNGFIDALAKSICKYKVLKTYEVVEPVAGKNVGEDILRDFPDKGSIDVVFTVHGGGLAVVDTLAFAGRNDEPEKGSVLSFEIPVAVVPAETIPAPPQRARVIGLTEGQPDWRLFIAEDQPENRLLLLWIDMRMPVMDGLEATRRIKAKDAGAQTRIIAVTALALEEERHEIQAAGCEGFNRKPYKDCEIFDALTKHLDVRFFYREEEPFAEARRLSENALFTNASLFSENNARNSNYMSVLIFRNASI
jgi:ribose transport system substrate-binding protein